MPNDNTSAWESAALGILHNDRTTQVNNNLYAAVKQNPDQIARDTALSRMMQIPVESVAANRDDVERQVTLQNINAPDLVQQSPVLARFLAEPANANIAHDDIPNARAIEQVSKPAPQDLPVSASPADYALAPLRGLGGVFNKTASGLNLVLSAFPRAYDSTAGLISGKQETSAQDWWFSRMVAPLDQNQQTFNTSQNANIVEKGLHSVGSLLGMMSTITLSGTGNVAPLAATTAETTAAQILGGAVKHGAASMAVPALSDSIDTAKRVYQETGNLKQAVIAMEAQYASSTIGGIVPLSVPGGLAARLGTGFVSGTASGEASRNIVNMALPEKMQQPFNFEDLLLSGIMGSVMGGVMGPRTERPAAYESIRKTYEQQQQVNQAEQQAQNIQAINELAASSKWRERDPDAFKAYIESVTEDGNLQNVYVDGKTFSEALAQSGITPEELATKIPEIAKQINEALQTDGYVRIPTSDFATHMAGTPVGEALLQSLKTDPEGMTFKDAQDFQANQNEVLTTEAKNLAVEGEARKAFDISKDAVQANIENNLSSVNRFSKDVNKIYAKLQTELTSRMAEREGITPEEAHAKYGAAIAADGSAGFDNVRGSYSPVNRMITLMKAADLSTFVHESGHWLLDSYSKIAAAENAPAEIKADVDAILKWIGAPELEAWNAMTLEQQRNGHEQLARGFEAYLMEGKAPTPELQSTFARIRSWMVSIYQSLRGLNVELSPEIRQVFDRMLASEEAIKQAEAARVFEPITRPEGVTDEAWSEYKAQGQQATDSAIAEVQAKSLRDLKWLNNAQGKLLREKQREAATARKAVRETVAKEVADQPIEKVKTWIRVGEMKDADGELIKVENGHKINSEALKAMFPESALDNPDLSTLRGMTSPTGMHPDVMADIFGFRSGEALMRELINDSKTEDKIAAITDQKMLEQHGEMIDPKAVNDSIQSAIHNDARAKFMATGLKLLTKSAIPARDLLKGAREAADAAIAQKKVKDINPRQYEAAETRSNKQALQLAAKKPEEAITSQRAALLNNQLAKVSRDAITEIQKSVDYLKKFDKESVINAVGHDHIQQINSILERFDLRRSISNKEIDQRKDLSAWLAEQEKEGFAPDIPEQLINEAYKKSYKDMTVEEFRGLVDTVKQIDHLGRASQKLFLAEKKASYEAIRDEITNSISVNSSHRESVDARTATTNAGMALSAIKRFGAAHIKAATWARILDGGKDGGAMWEYLVRPANERGNMEVKMRAEATKELTEILEPLTRNGKVSKQTEDFPTIGRKLSRQEKFSLALNMGNEGNIQRLLDGEGWRRDQVEPVLSSLTREEWQAVQRVWDYIETYKPLIGAKEKRIYGVEPAWIDPAQLTVRTAEGDNITLKGGYYPAVYDPVASMRAETHADAEVAKRQMQGANTSATTRRTFTKDRTAAVKGRPILLSLSGLYNHVNDVIHDLSWHEWLIDSNKLMRSHTIDSAIRDKYGPEVRREFKKWIDDIAEGGRGANHAMDIAISRLRQGVSAAGLGFNVMSAILQPIGITQSFVRIGAKWAGLGVQKYLSSPVEMTKEANSKSDFMANRARTRFRELNELRNTVQDQSKVKSFIGDHAYMLMMRFQQIVDVPTWHGAYEKAIAEGNAEKRSIELADQAVIDSQGGGDIKDLSSIERGSATQKLFTTFYSFMNTALNIGVERYQTATPAGRTRGKVAADMVMLYVVPALLATALKDALTPGDSGDYDDWGKFIKKMASSELDYLMGLFVIGREFSQAGKMLIGDGFDYSGPSGLRMISDTTKFAKQSSQLEFDDAFRKALINLLGDFSGIPSAQLNRTIAGVEALSEGKTNSPLAIPFGYQEKR